MGKEMYQSVFLYFYKKYIVDSNSVYEKKKKKKKQGSPCNNCSSFLPEKRKFE